MMMMMINKSITRHHHRHPSSLSSLMQLLLLCSYCILFPSLLSSVQCLQHQEQQQQQQQQQQEFHLEQPNRYSGDQYSIHQQQPQQQQQQQQNKNWEVEFVTFSPPSPSSSISTDSDHHHHSDSNNVYMIDGEQKQYRTASSLIVPLRFIVSENFNNSHKKQPKTTNKRLEKSNYEIVSFASSSFNDNNNNNNHENKSSSSSNPSDQLEQTNRYRLQQGRQQQQRFRSSSSPLFVISPALQAKKILSTSSSSSTTTTTPSSSSSSSSSNNDDDDDQKERPPLPTSTTTIKPVNSSSSDSSGTTTTQHDETIATASSEIVSSSSSLNMAMKMENNKCEFILPSSGGNLTSLGYPTVSYPRMNGQICRYRISKRRRQQQQSSMMIQTAICQLELRFHYFNLATGIVEKNLNEFNHHNNNNNNPLDCNVDVDDYLEFDGVDNNNKKNIQRFCGKKWQGQTIILDQFTTPTNGNENNDANDYFEFKLVLSSQIPSSSLNNHQNGQSVPYGFNIEYRPISGWCDDGKKIIAATATATIGVAKRSRVHNEEDNERSSSDVVSESAAITTTIEAASPCEHHHTAVEFDIRSDGYPNRNYSNNLDCVHHIHRSSAQVCGIEIRFRKFHLEPSEGCAYDFVEIDGESFCGRLPDNSRNIFHFDRDHDLKTISFQTDSQMTAPGFDIHVRQLSDCANTFIPASNDHHHYHDASLHHNQHYRTQKCTFTTDDIEGRLTSLRYPAPYPDDILCAYTIKRKNKILSSSSRNYCAVELRFEQFDLQESSSSTSSSHHRHHHLQSLSPNQIGDENSGMKDCIEDFFELENHRYCGHTLNGTTKVIRFNNDNDNAVKFLFRSDSTGSTENRGFALNYTQIECMEGETPYNSFPSAITSQNRKRATTSPKQQQPSITVSKSDSKLTISSSPSPSSTANTPTSTTSSTTINMAASSSASHTTGTARNRSYFYREPCMTVYDERHFELVTTDLVNGSYRENLDCTYSIRKASNRVCYLEMHFRHFDLEASPECQYDYVEIGTAVRLCGTLQAETTRIYRFVDQNEMIVTFHTDASTERSGFRIIVDQLECEGDRIIRNESSSESESESGSDESYEMDNDGGISGNGVRSSLPINTESPTKPVSSRSINTQQQSTTTTKPSVNNEPKDVLQSLDDRSQSLTISGNGNGEDRNNSNGTVVILQQQESASNEFDLGNGGNSGSGEVITSGGSSSSSSISSKFLSNNHHSQSAELYCSKIYDQKEFFIHSPGYPAPYDPELDCLFMIRPYAPTVCRLEINFDHFELQPYDFTKNCFNSDFVDIDSREQLCGKMVEPQSKVYTFVNQSFFVHFHSDSFRTSHDKGFRLYVRQIDCAGGSGGGGGGGASFHARSPPSSLSVKSPSSTSSVTPSAGSTAFSRCNKIYTTAVFELKSPHYPIPYLSNSYCQYRVLKLRRPSLKICYLELQFKDFDLQDSYNCTRDYLSLNGGVRLCGKISRDTVRLFPFFDHTPEFLLTFATDNSGSGRGFHLIARQHECPGSGSSGGSNDIGFASPPTTTTRYYTRLQQLQANQQCQQTHSATMFELESPNFFDGYYLPGLSCTYTIRKRHANICQLELYFIELDIEPSVRCRTDYLLIDGVPYCNLNRPSNGMLQLPFYESTHKRLYFQTSNLVEMIRRRKGFLAQIRQIDCSTNTGPTSAPYDRKFPPASSFGFNNNDIEPLPILPPPPPPPPQPIPSSVKEPKFIFLPALPSICEICVTEMSGYIQSYDYPNYYPPNVNCTYRITALPGNCMAQIHFEQFNFDYTPECDRDYLEINGIRYCGGQLRGVSMILLNKRKEDLSIRMMTNSRGAIVAPSFRGFRARYTQLPCLDSANDAKDPSLTMMPPSSNKNVLSSGGSGSSMNGTTKTIYSSKQRSSTPTPTTTSSPISTHHSPSSPSPDDQHPSSQPIHCDQTFATSRFDLKSPGFPYRYFDQLDCRYRIRRSSPNVCRLRVTFNYFNVVGEDGHCSGDYLEMFNAKICGILERYTKKEIPFLHDYIQLHFHTNAIQTANGFHLVVEQIDCISGSSSSGGGSNYDEDLGTIHTSQSISGLAISTTRPPTTTATTKSKQSPPHQQIVQHQKHFDDEYDPIQSEFDQSNRAFTKTPLPPPFNGSGGGGEIKSVSPTQPISPSSTSSPSPIDDYSQQQQQSTMVTPSNDAKRRTSMISSVVYEEGEEEEQQHEKSGTTKENKNLPKPSSIPASTTTTTTPTTNTKSSPMLPRQQATYHQPTLCHQQVVQDMYLELSSLDLNIDSPNTATCQLIIRKSRPNICQLDIMFVRFVMNDTNSSSSSTLAESGSCMNQYISIDGEHICGVLPEMVMKKFWFIKSEIPLYVTEIRDGGSGSGGIGDDNRLMTEFIQPKFIIKIRQVVCATTNGGVPQSQSIPIRFPSSSSSTSPIKGRERAMNFYEQQQLLQQNFKPNDDDGIGGGDNEQKTLEKPPTRRPSPTYRFDPRGRGSGGGGSIGSINSKSQFSYQQQQQQSYDNAYEHHDHDHQQHSQTFDPYCDLIATEVEYKIVGPSRSRSNGSSGGGGYDSQKRCRYTIRKVTPNTCAIDIVFRRFQLAEDHHQSSLSPSPSMDHRRLCTSEYVEIDKGKICGIFPSGHQRRYYFLPNENEKIIYYWNNGSNTDSGDGSNSRGDFVLEIHQIEDCSKPLPPSKTTLTTPTICDASTKLIRGSLKSPNYPAPYDHYTRCTYRIQAAGPQYCSVRFNMKDLDLQRSSSSSSSSSTCEKDFLTLLSPSMNQMKLCGRLHELQQKEYIVPFDNLPNDGTNQRGGGMMMIQKSVQLRFQTDSSGTGRGFHLEYTQQLCDTSSKDEMINHYQQSSSSNGIKGFLGGGGGGGGGAAIAGRVQFIPMHKTNSVGNTFGYKTSSSPSLTTATKMDSNSLGRANPMRPYYPPNYVSRAHLLKQTSRNQLIKMMLQSSDDMISDSGDERTTAQMIEQQEPSPTKTFQQSSTTDTRAPPPTPAAQQDNKMFKLMSPTSRMIATTTTATTALSMTAESQTTSSMLLSTTEPLPQTTTPLSTTQPPAQSQQPPSSSSIISPETTTSINSITTMPSSQSNTMMETSKITTTATSLEDDDNNNANLQQSPPTTTVMPLMETITNTMTTTSA